MDNTDVQRILLSITNLYNEYLPMDPSLAKVWLAAGSVMEVLYRDYMSIQNNTFIDKTETLKTIPYFKLDAEQGLYDEKYANSLLSLSIDDQISALKQTELGIQLSFSTESTRIPLVYAMRLQQSFNSKVPLAIYQDYFIYNNMVYLLPKFILGRRSNSKVLHAFEIKIDDQRLERNWGSLLNLEVGTLLPRYEYRTVLSIIDRLFANEITIKNIKDAIQTWPAWANFDLWDMYSRTLPTSLGRLYSEWGLSPSHFVTILPESAALDQVRVAVLEHIMQEIQSPSSQFFSFYGIERVDGAHTTDSLFPYYEPVTYTFDYQNNGTYPRTYHYFPNIYQGSQSQWIATTFTSLKTGVTIPVINTRAQDYFEITLHDFPEIPRNFTATETSTPGQIQLSWRPNYDGTTQFGLYGAATVNDTYALITTVDNDPNASSISVIHDKIASGYRHFKLLALAGTEQSFMTMDLDATGL